MYVAIPAAIPFKPTNPKTRLSCMLDQEERERFARMMLCDVVAAARMAGCEPFIIATEPFVFGDTRVILDEHGLNDALNDLLLRTPGPLLVLMADLPLTTPDAIRRLTSSSADVAIVPGRGGGTNAIFLQHADRFRVSYYGGSFSKHREIARESGLSCEIIDSFRIHTDIDEKEDLVELLIHGEGLSRAYLVELGFSVTIERGRIGVERKGEGDMSGLMP
jgi:2-phospho-L-lactate guanylyltransferase